VPVATGPVVNSSIPLFFTPPGSSVWKRTSLTRLACTSVVRNTEFFTF